MKLSFATSNPNKVSEANVVGKEFGIEFVRLAEVYPEVRDPSVSVVAREGAKFVYEKVGEPVIVEDAGMYVDALSGFPGSYSKFVIQHIGNDGILKLLDGISERSATFRAAIGYCDGKGTKVFEGVVEGTIAESEMGTEGFGYDPIFIPKGQKETFAENQEMKNQVSHRRKAFEKLCRWLSDESS
ncbi:MAG: XTP/dITP diphosphatase [Candidatus Altiarchaeota archaeon]